MMVMLASGDQACCDDGQSRPFGGLPMHLFTLQVFFLRITLPHGAVTGNWRAANSAILRTARRLRRSVAFKLMLEGASCARGTIFVAAFSQ
jgi:hypothetical protein